MLSVTGANSDSRPFGRAWASLMGLMRGPEPDEHTELRVGVRVKVSYQTAGQQLAIILPYIRLP
jgi:hypothetical protein